MADRRARATSRTGLSCTQTSRSNQAPAGHSIRRHVYNSRGVVHRQAEGGVQERELAAKYWSLARCRAREGSLPLPLKSFLFLRFWFIHRPAAPTTCPLTTCLTTCISPCFGRRIDGETPLFGRKLVEINTLFWSWKTPKNHCLLWITLTLAIALGRSRKSLERFSAVRVHFERQPRVAGPSGALLSGLTR